ncbi:unnamed protein product, partial [Ectocarpus sp. 13 AM-2016]
RPRRRGGRGRQAAEGDGPGGEGQRVRPRSGSGGSGSGSWRQRRLEATAALVVGLRGARGRGGQPEPPGSYLPSRGTGRGEASSYSGRDHFHAGCRLGPSRTAGGGRDDEKVAAAGVESR